MQVDVYEYVTVEMRTSASVIVLYGSILIDIVMYDGETDVQALKPEGNRWLGLKTLSGEPISIPPKRLGLGIRYAIGGTMFGLGWALTGACPGPLFALVGNGVTVMIVAIGSALAGTWLYGLLRLSNMAVRVGFEPTEESPPQRFSRPPDSTTLAPHRLGTGSVLSILNPRRGARYSDPIFNNCSACFSASRVRRSPESIRPISRVRASPASSSISATVRPPASFFST